MVAGPAVTASLASSHPQERATPLLLPFPATFRKAPPCSFSHLQSLPGLLVSIFLEHFMVAVALLSIYLAICFLSFSKLHSC